MSIEIAAHSTNLNTVDLQHSNDTIVTAIRLLLSGAPEEHPSRWVLLGRVVITNFDDDDQNASAELRHVDGMVVIDRVDVRIVGRHSQSLSLQAPLTLGEDDIIDIACSTYNGTAQAASLIALSVDQLQPPV